MREKLRVALLRGVAMASFAFAAGCVGESVVTVAGGDEAELEDFGVGGTVEAVSGKTGVTSGGADISDKAGVVESVAGGTGVTSGGGLLSMPSKEAKLESGASYVKVEGHTVSETRVSRVEGETGVEIKEDPAEKAILYGGIDCLSADVAVAVLPPPLETGDDEMRLTIKKIYVELMRCLERRGCRLAACERTASRRPADLGRLLDSIVANGYDIGYKIALAEKSVEAPRAEFVVEVLGCRIDMVSGKITAVVRVRGPSSFDGSPLAARVYRSRVPDKDASVAVESLFADK